MSRRRVPCSSSHAHCAAEVGEKGRAAVAALTALIDGTPTRARTLLRTQLVVRESTAPAP